MDSHKRSATIGVLDEAELSLMAERFGTDSEGYRRLLAAGPQFPARLKAGATSTGGSRRANTDGGDAGAQAATVRRGLPATGQRPEATERRRGPAERRSAKDGPGKTREGDYEILRGPLQPNACSRADGALGYDRAANDARPAG